MERSSALQVSEYKSFGGGFFDSVAHSEIFRDMGPYEFGVKSAKLFSSTSMLGMTNKKWTYMTAAQKNVYTLPGGTNEYTWSVVGDADIECRITAFISGGTTPGKGGAEIEVAVDRHYIKRPMIMKTASDNSPGLHVLDVDLEPYGTHSWKVRLKIQDGNPNAYIDPQYLQPGQTLTRIGTSVANEENGDYGIDNYSSMSKLRSTIGQYANEIKFTDKFIRQEMAAASKGVANTGTYMDAVDGKSYRDAFSRGIIYQDSLKMPGQNDEIKVGFFIPSAERRLLERTEMDRELMMEFGRLQYDIDGNKRVKKMAPGWRQIVRDGQYLPHGGSFTLNQLYDFLHQIMFRRRGFMNREPYLVSGTGGISYLSTLIEAQASVFQTLEPGFAVRDADTKSGVHKYEKEWGYQFTKIRFAQGVTVQIMYDPMKDNDQYFKEKAPGSYLPLESFQIDILDFGKTESAAENTSGENICMVREDNVDYYFSVANAIDWKRGVMKSGENVWNFGKQLEIYRELSGSLCVWDASAVGRIEWVPGYVG